MSWGGCDYMKLGVEISNRTSYHSMRPIKFNKEPIKFFQSSFYLPVCLCFAGKKSTCASDPIGDGEFSECSLTNWPSVSQWADIYKTTRGDTKSQPSRVGWAFLCDRSKERERPNFVVQVIWVSFSWPCMCSVTNQKSTDDRTCNAKTFQDGRGVILCLCQPLLWASTAAGMLSHGAQFCPPHLLYLLQTFVSHP